MRFGYFGRPIGKTGGIARYTHQLIQAIERVEPGLGYTVYSNQPCPEISALKGRKSYGPRRLGRVGWEQFWLPAQLMLDRPDVYHSTDFTLPVSSAAPSVVTVHDLIFMRQKQGTSWQARLLYRVLTGASVRKARRIITVSEYSARDVKARFRVPDNKIRAIPLGVHQGLADAARGQDTRAIAAAAGAEGRYVLFVGLVTVRKGVLTLIDAFSQAHARGAVDRLVLAGLTDSTFEDVQQAIERTGCRDRIILAGAVDDVSLAALYSHAAVYCFPSYHEGFGLSVLEAMLMGCPVISSNATSLPEVVGDAGVLIPPDDAGLWAEWICRITSDKDESRGLAQKGRERAAAFTWERTAARTIEVYKEVARN